MANDMTPAASLSTAISAVLPALLSACILVLLLKRVRVRIRRPRLAVPVWLGGGLSTLGFTLVLSSPAGALDRRSGSPLRKTAPASATPWSETEGFSPPRPSVSTEAPPWDRRSEPSTLIGDEAPKSTVHPAIHGTPRRNTADLTPLFPRVVRSQRCDADRDAERRACMARHPAGKDLSGDAGLRRETYRVGPGDTLWDIAATVLATKEEARIARYWPLIHRANRSTIGSDPNLIKPGMALELPAEPRR